MPAERTVIRKKQSQLLTYAQMATLMAALVLVVSPAWSMIMMFLLGLFQVVLSLMLLTRRSRMARGLKHRLLAYHLGVAAYIPLYISVINRMRTSSGDFFWMYNSLVVLPALTLCVLMIWMTYAGGTEKWSVPNHVEGPDILDT